MKKENRVNDPMWVNEKSLRESLGYTRRGRNTTKESK